jgi:hypothetical protein
VNIGAYRKEHGATTARPLTVLALTVGRGVLHAGVAGEPRPICRRRHRLHELRRIPLGEPGLIRDTQNKTRAEKKAVAVPGAICHS